MAGNDVTAVALMHFSPNFILLSKREIKHPNRQNIIELKLPPL